MTSFVKNFVGICSHVAFIARRWPKVVTCIILRHKLDFSLSPAQPPSLRSRVHRSVSCPCFCQPVPSSCWPLALPRLPTSPHNPEPPGRARPPALSLTGGKLPRNQPSAVNVSTLRPRAPPPEVKPRGQGKRAGPQKTESEN